MIVLAHAHLHGHGHGHDPGSWGIVADGLLAVWTALLGLGPLLARSGAPRARFWLVGLLAAGGAALVTAIGKLLEVYPGHPLFPSGHTAWAATIAILLVARDRRWLPVVVPLLALLEVALVRAHYHDPVDLVGGLVVAAIAGAAGIAALRRPHVRVVDV